MSRKVLLIVLLIHAAAASFAQERKTTFGYDRAALPFINIRELQISSRFDYTDRGPGSVSRRDVQYRIRIRPQINFVASGNTYLQLRAETGKGFANSWDYTGIGLGEKTWNFYVKTFTLGQKLGSHMAVEAGGLEFDRGVGSQITYANNNSYLTGYRGVYSGAPMDRISFTAGYVGDFNEQNFFRRTHLGRFNYFQGLVQKRLSSDIEFSAQYNSIEDVQFLGQAFSFAKVPGRIVQEVNIEMMERVTDHARYGWAVAIGRNLTERGSLRGQIIFSDIPQDLYMKNGVTLLHNQGEIDRGKRLSGKLTCKFGSSWETGIWAGRRLDETPGKRWVVQVHVSRDFAVLLNRLISRRPG